jgi:hypothetical protein
MAVLSGQTTVTTAGTAVVLGTQTINGAILIKADPNNTGDIYIGNDGNDDVSSTTGFILATGDVVVIDNITYLGNLYVDAATNGDKVSWISVEV